MLGMCRECTPRARGLSIFPLTDLLPAAPDAVGAEAADDEALGAEAHAPHAEAIA